MAKGCYPLLSIKRPFWRLKYIHVSIDILSGPVFALAHMEQKAKDVIKDFVLVFSTLGISQDTKTENGPVYASQKFTQMLNHWGMKHTTGIPHSPTG